MEKAKFLLPNQTQEDTLKLPMNQSSEFPVDGKFKVIIIPVNQVNNSNNKKPRRAKAIRCTM